MRSGILLAFHVLRKFRHGNAPLNLSVVETLRVKAKTSFQCGHISSLLIIDIDECASPAANDCDGNAVCNNTEGSYDCSCLSGYQGDGKNCSGKEIFLFCYFSLVIPFQNPLPSDHSIK